MDDCIADLIAENIRICLELGEYHRISHVVQSWLLKWGEKEDGLDRVVDMNSGAVKKCLQVSIIDKLGFDKVAFSQACNDEKLNLVTSSSPTTLQQM